MTGWESFSPERPPLAPHVGPFAHRAFLEAWWAHFEKGIDPDGAPEQRVLLRAAGGDAAWAFLLTDDRLEVAGDADVTDYHSPLGDDPSHVVHDAFLNARPGMRFSFDSLPEEAADPVRRAVEATGRAATMEVTDQAMVLHLEGDEPLALLDGKQRHEVRRKERRFADVLGEVHLDDDQGRFDDFVSMHRSSAGDKGRFMTSAMEGFFRDLMATAGARLDTLVTGDGRSVAAAFGFEDDGTYYLYNSAFDPEHAGVSPGIVLLHRVIDRAAKVGRSRFDFLKGTEDYKRRLGAQPRALYTVEGVV